MSRIRLIGTALAIVVGSIGGASNIRADVVFNEVCSSNSSVFKDDRKETPDWVEFRNTGSTAVDLSGWGFSDKEKKLNKWTFPKGTSIAAGGFLVVCCDGKDYTKNGYIHTSFSLSSEGEQLYLSKDGQTITAQCAFGKIPCDCSCAPSGSSKVYYDMPTPGKANTGTSYSAPLAPVQFSKSRGIYQEAFNLTLTHPESGVEIYYTLDGSMPSKSSSYYSGAIAIPAKTTVVRARAYKDGTLPYHNVTAHTYVFLASLMDQTKPANCGAPDTWSDMHYNERGTCPASYKLSKTVVYNDPTRQQLYTAMKTIPIVSVSGNPTELFNSEEGILCKTWTKPYEREVSVEWVTSPVGDTNLVFDAMCGFEVHGGWVRRFDKTPKKSFRLRFRGKYGMGTLDRAVLEDKARTNPQTTGDNGSSSKHIKSIVLRGENGYSWPSLYTTPNGNYWRDEYARRLQHLVSGYGTRGCWVHLFINGLYWGVYNTVERVGADYMANNDDDDTVASDWAVLDSHGLKDENSYQDAQSFSNYFVKTLGCISGASESGHGGVRHKITTPEQFEEFEKLFDCPKYIDYMILEYFFGNLDWPFNNFVAAGAPSKGKGFRFFVWDTEGGFTSTATDRYNNSDTANYKTSPQYLQRALEGFLEFRHRWCDRMAELFENGGAMTTNQTTPLFRSRKQLHLNFLFGESARWGAYHNDYKIGPGGIKGTNTFLNSYGSDAGYLNSRIQPFKQQMLAHSLAHRVATPRVSDLTSTSAVLKFGTKDGTITTLDPSTIYYMTDGTDPRTMYTGHPRKEALTCGNGGKITVTRTSEIFARAYYATNRWSAPVRFKLKASGADGVQVWSFAKTQSGQKWDANNWLLDGDVVMGYPNKACSYASIGIPAKVSDKGYRNIDLSTNSITVGTIEFTNGAFTNRIRTADNGRGSIRLDNGSSNAKIMVSDVSHAGMAEIDLDPPNAIRLLSNLELVTDNPMGDVQWGSIYFKGILDGGNKSIIKKGVGRATIGCTNAIGTTVGAISIEAGALGITKTLTADSISGNGTAFFAAQGTNDASVANCTAILSGALSAAKVDLYVPTEEGGETFYGGVIATALTDPSKCRVFVLSVNGTAKLKGDNYGVASDAIVTKYTIASGPYAGRLTYKVVVPKREVPKVSGVYTWVGAPQANWNDKSSWTDVVNGTWPQLATDGAVVPRLNTDNLDINLRVGSYLIAAITNDSSSAVSFTNGELGFYRFLTRGDVTFKDVAVKATKSGARIYATLDDRTISFEGAVGTINVALHNLHANTMWRFANGSAVVSSPMTFSEANFAQTIGIASENATVQWAGFDANEANFKVQVKLGPNTPAGGGPAIKINQAFTARAGSTLSIDATQVGSGTYTILSATSFTDSASFVSKAQVTVASGITYQLSKSGGEIKLVLSGGIPSGKTAIAVPHLETETVVYDGNNHKVEWTAPTGVLLSYSSASWVDAGSYSVTCTLTDTTKYIWADGSSNPKVLTFTIQKAKNLWHTNCQVVPATFVKGLTPEIYIGSPEAGTPVANYTAEQISTLSAGSYELIVRVTDNPNFEPLEARVPFTILSSPEDDPQEDDPPTGTLPDGYTQLTYVATTSSANNLYVDTGVKAQRNLKVTAKILPTESKSTGYYCVCGASDDSARCFPIYFQLGKWAIGSGCSAVSAVAVSLKDVSSVIATVDATGANGTLKVNDEDVYLTYNGAYTVPASGLNYNLYIFARNTKGSPQLPFIGRIYALSIEVNGVLSRNFVPCKNGKGVAGFYDTVKGSFYAPLNGSLVAGDEVKPPTPTHTHSWGEWTITTPASCTNVGLKTSICSVANCPLGGVKTETILALGHAWDAGVETKPATTTETGIMTFTCTRAGCGEIRTEVIPPKQVRRLPEGYTELTFVQSTGSQYIDSGLKAEEGLVIEADACMTKNDTGNTHLVAAYSDKAEAYLLGITKDGHYIVGLGDSTKGDRYLAGTANVSNKTVTTLLNNNTYAFSVNGVEQTRHLCATSPTHQYNLYIFARNDAGTANNGVKAILYSLKMTLNGVRHEFVPAKRNSDSKVGLYELVANEPIRFCEPKGADLIAGEVVETDKPDEPIDPTTATNPTVNGIEFAPTEVFTKGHARTGCPILYPSAPELAGTEGHQTITFNQETVGVPVYYTARIFQDNPLAIKLEFNDAAKPVIGGVLTEGEAVRLIGEQVVFNVTKVYSGLYYGVSYATNIKGPWSIPTEWHQAQQDGALTEPLEANKHGAACFYRVVVQDEINENK